MKNLTVLNKILLILIFAVAGVGVFYYVSLNKKLTAAVDEQLKMIDNQKEEKQMVIDSVRNVVNIELTTLQNSVTNLSKYSNNLIKQLKNYEKNPDYDINYITAVDIIARSDYKGRNDSVVERENN